MLGPGTMIQTATEERDNMSKLVKGKFYRSSGNDDYLYRIIKTGPKRVTVRAYTLRKEWCGAEPVTLSRSAALQLLTEVTDDKPE